MPDKMPEAFKSIFDSWPKKVRLEATEIRSLIHEVAAEIKLEHFSSAPLEEALKWGEPAFVLKTGSTLRMGYREKNPDVLSLYFICNTNLVDTFRELYGDQLVLVDNRELQIQCGDTSSKTMIRDCIRKTLEYHKIKHLPLLGG